MGGRGTYAAGNNVAYTYNTVAKIDGVKILKGLGRNHDLPMESHTSDMYILLDKDGNFKQLRIYDESHLAKMDIDYHTENGKIELHFHDFLYGPQYKSGMLREPGKTLPDSLLAKYKKYFKGIKL